MTTLSNGALTGTTVPADRIINNSQDVARKFPGSALEDDSITAAKLAPGAVEATDVADGSITTAKLGALAVTAAKLADGAVSTTAKLAAGIVTKAKAAVFVSAEQTGTGSAQNVAHGLGAVPAVVLVAPTDLAPAVAGVYTVTEGAHDATNVVVTVTSGKKFKVMAWA